MEPRRILIELLPHERAALLRFCYTSDEVREQLEACASSPHVETILFTGGDVYLLAGDLTHAIVKHGCRDDAILDLSQRLDYVADTGDGSLDSWR